MILKEFINERREKFGDKHIIRKVKMFELKCDVCDETHSREVKHYKKMKNNSLFTKDFCNVCWRPILNNRPEKIEKMRNALKKLWSNPQKRIDQSNIAKKHIIKSGYMIGDKNPMKNLETRKKVGKTRSERMTTQEKKKYSNGTKKAWEEGKFIGVNNSGKCLWYDYKHSNGNIYKVQGTWELDFIKWLDKNNIDFKCHEGRVPYIDDEDKSKNYYPDFYIYIWNSYVDIKSDYTYKGQERKFEILKKTSKVPIKLLFRKDLNKLGIKVK
jgi:hypothetical protein